MAQEILHDERQLQGMSRGVNPNTTIKPASRQRTGQRVYKQVGNDRFIETEQIYI